MVTNGQWQRIFNDSVCAAQTINSLVFDEWSGTGSNCRPSAFQATAAPARDRGAIASLPAWTRL
jgi:hypothetical protein